MTPPTVSLWRRVARRSLTAPVLRLFAPGWPDAGRKIVQLPVLDPLVARAATNRAIVRVLNAGAGEGLHTPLIRKYAAGALLLEFDFSLPTRSADPLVQRFCASLAAIPVRSGSIDLALCTEVLEHVADDQSAVAELCRVLSPGGYLVLSVPTPPAVFDKAHVREGYTPAQLTAIFDAHGLEIIESRFCMHRLFQAVLRYWKPRRVPLGAILTLAWLDRLLTPGLPMDLAVLARRKRADHRMASAS